MPSMTTERHLLMTASVLDVRGITHGQGRSHHTTGIDQGNGNLLGVGEGFDLLVTRFL